MKRIFAGSVLFVAAIVSLSVVVAEPLKTDYPKPLMGIGPVPIKSPNIEPPHAMRPWEYDLPAGCSNIAYRKEVSASDEFLRHGALNMITDGDKSGEEIAVVEFNPGKLWVQIDLGKESEIYAILVWHFHWFVRVYKAVIVQVSNDPDFKKDVTTIFNNDIDDLNGQGVGKDYTYVETNYGRLFDAKGKKARYVRLWSHGNVRDDLNHYIEVEVWGK